MNRNKLKWAFLLVMLLSAQCRAAIFGTESLRPSKIVHVKQAIFRSDGQEIDLTQQVAARCTDKYICTVNLQEILRDNFTIPFTIPYDFIVDYDTTRHKNRHKEKLHRTKPTVTIKRIKSHAGTGARWLILAGIITATLA